MRPLKIYLIMAFAFITTCISAQQFKVVKSKISKFPEIDIIVQDRDPNPWKSSEISLTENGEKVSDFEMKLSKSEQPQKQIILILFENSYWPSYDIQREYFKQLLSSTLSKSTGNEDVIYLSEFDWTDKNGKVIAAERISKGNAAQILETVSKIKKPVQENRLHQFSEVNTALIQALDYLAAVEADSTLSKSIVILSDELSNIYNAQHNQTDIIYSSRKKNIPIYAVRYPRMADKYNFEKVCQESYGLHIQSDPQNIAATSEAFSKLLLSIPQRALGNIYNFNFKTAVKSSGKPIRIEVLNQTTKQKESVVLMSPFFSDWLFGSTTGIILIVVILLVIAITVYYILACFKKKAKKEKQEQEDKIRKLSEENDKKLSDHEAKILGVQQQKEEAEMEKEFLKQKAIFDKASQDRFSKRVRQGILSDSSGNHYEISKITTVIGRENTCDYSINNPTVSKKHAFIFFEKQESDGIPEPSNTFYLVDNNSSNGTFVNGNKIKQPIPLKDGDIIKIGNISFSFRS